MKARCIRRWLVSGAALVYLVIMYVSGAPPTHQNLIRAEARGVYEQLPETVTGVVVTYAGGSVSFARRDGRWVDRETGTALAANSASLLARGLKVMHTATPVRILRPEEVAAVAAAAYGLDPPAIRVRLSPAVGAPMTANFGRRANDGILQYMRVEGRGETYLMSGFVGETWQALFAAEAGTPGSDSTKMRHDFGRE